MPTEEELQRYRRAREVLADGGWVFDEFINNETRVWLTSDIHDSEGRERAYMRARVATELKIELMREVETYETEKKIADRREELVERSHGRHSTQRPN
jgi:hypothetical protein